MVIGKNEFDSGKTTVCRIIARLLLDNGIQLTPFKPHSGFNYWFNFKYLDEYFKFGDFYSKDVYLILKDLNLLGKYNPIILNPVHRVLGPSKKLVDETYFDEFLFVRFTKLLNSEGIPDSIYYINQNHRGQPDIIKKIKLLLRNRKVININSLKDLELQYSKHYNISIESCFSFVNEKVDNIIIECYNDAAYPFMNIEKYVDSIILSTPGRIYLINVEKYFKKCYLISTIHNKMLLTVPQVIEKSLVLDKFDVPAVATIEPDSNRIFYPYLEKLIDYLLKLK
ncbi:MAG: hypothetical protein ACTSRP_18510 [Candidatus Helarchaeota archaeon]